MKRRDRVCLEHSVERRFSICRRESVQQEDRRKISELDNLYEEDVRVLRQYIYYNISKRNASWRERIKFSSGSLPKRSKSGGTRYIQRNCGAVQASSSPPSQVECSRKRFHNLFLHFSFAFPLMPSILATSRYDCHFLRHFYFQLKV